MLFPGPLIAQQLGKKPEELIAGFYDEHVRDFADFHIKFDRFYTTHSPENRELAAQYLLLFEMSLPYGLDLNNQIDVDKSATRVVATLDNLTTRELSAFDSAATAWLSREFKTPEPLSATGAFVM